MLYSVYFNAIHFFRLVSLVSEVYENITSITGANSRNQLLTFTGADSRNQLTTLIGVDSRNQLTTLTGADSRNQLPNISTIPHPLFLNNLF